MTLRAHQTTGTGAHIGFRVKIGTISNTRLGLDQRPTGGLYKTEYTQLSDALCQARKIAAMIKTVSLSALAALAFGVMAPPAVAGDAAAGEGNWRSCRSCHAITDNAGTVIQRGGRTGPNLFGLPGRAVASFAGFNYSAPLVEYGATGAVWTEELFAEYVTDPTSFLRTHLDNTSVRSPMSFRMRSGAEDMWAYLESVSPAAE